ncbi:MAG: hypothetical protein C4317_10045 [Acidimicrobiia bacterium]
MDPIAQHETTGLWWVRDRAGHGGSVWKYLGKAQTDCIILQRQTNLAAPLLGSIRGQQDYLYPRSVFRKLNDLR